MSPSPPEGVVRPLAATMLDALPDPVFVHDVNGILVDVNRAACDLLDYDRETLLTLAVSDIESADSFSRSRAVWAELRTGDVASRAAVYRRADGSTLGVEVRLSAIVQDERRLLCAVARPGPEQSLPETGAELALYRKVFEHSSEAIAVIDHQGRYLRQNPAHRELLGYEDHDLVDKTPALHLGPAAFERIVAELAEKGRMRGEFTSRTKMGADVRIELSAVAVPGGEGQPPLYVGIKRDLGDARRREQERVDRDRAELEESLRQAQKMELIGQLAAGVAHDFNNLLTPIMGYAEVELLSRRDAKDTDGLRQIVLAAERGKELTGQLLAFGRKQLLEMRVLDLCAHVEDASKILHRLIPADVRVHLDLGSDIRPVRADATQMQQVLMNLATNARDAMPDGGEMSIGVRNVVVDETSPLVRVLGSSGSYVQLSVSDTGCGMDEATLEHVFEPFFTQKADGTGLGLSIVHGILRQHGGFVRAHSELGRGSTFEVYLPVVEETAEASRVEPGATGATGGETILVVEDEEQVRALLARVLDSQGYRVLQASDGTEAIRVAQGYGHIDLLLTDVVMPGMNGRVLHETLLEGQPGLPVLFISGYARDGLTENGQLEPGISMIEKPFSASTLCWRVREALPRRGDSSQSGVHSRPSNP